MNQPARRFVGDARPTSRQQRWWFRRPFGLNEHFGKGRMCRISGQRVQHHLGVTGQLQAPGTVAEVAQRDPPQFEIGVFGNTNLQSGLYTLVLPYQLDQTGPKPAGLGCRCLGDRLAHRPEHAAVQIAQIEKETIAVLGRIGVPAGQRQFTPRRIASAGSGEQGGVATIGERSDVQSAGVLKQGSGHDGFLLAEFASRGKFSRLFPKRGWQSEFG